ncbi:MAG TPA: hypothetical protein VE870_09000 [Bacteroidales bacterium]|nr:hypothetical protein [Bacteroidales bacterium]
MNYLFSGKWFFIITLCCVWLPCHRLLAQDDFRHPRGLLTPADVPVVRGKVLKEPFAGMLAVLKQSGWQMRTTVEPGISDSSRVARRIYGLK